MGEEGKYRHWVFKREGKAGKYTFRCQPIKLTKTGSTAVEGSEPILLKDKQELFDKADMVWEVDDLKTMDNARLVFRRKLEL